MKVTMPLTVGRLLCGTVRDFLNKCKFQGMDITFIESSGWIERDFIVKGSRKDIETIRISIQNYINA